MDDNQLMTAVLGGMSDLFSMPHTAVAAALTAFLLLFRHDDSVRMKGVLGFLSAHFIMSVLLRVGVLNGFLWTQGYFYTVVVLYSLTGLFFVCLGGFCFLSWHRAYQSGLGKFCFPKIAALGRNSSKESFWTGIILGVFYAVGSLSSPVNVSIMALANEIFLPGLLWRTVGLMLIYESVLTVSLGVLFFAVQYLFRVIKISKGYQYRSVILIILAGVYLALGMGFLVTFIQQLL